MKKKLLSILLSVFMLVFGLFGISVLPFTASAADEYTGTGTFKQCTGTLTSGYYVFGGGSATSISAINNTVGTSWIKFTTTTSTTTTSTSGTITNPVTSIVWYYDADKGTFKNGENYVNWPSTGNSGGVGVKITPLTVTETATAGVYNITVTATPARYLRLNGTSGYRFYTSGTGTNTFYFFKLEEAQHEHAYAWDGNVGADGSHTLTCANTDGKCDVTTTTEDCTWKNGFCSVCDAEAPECAHPTTTEVAEVPATCTEVGYTAGVQCTVCNQYTSGHEEIEALGHTEVIDAAKDATCTETGLTEGKHCSVCEEVLVAQEEVSELGHDYVDGVCSVCKENQPTKLTVTREAFGNNSGYAWHTWTATTTKGDSISGSGFIYGTTKDSIQINGSKAGDYIYNTTPLPGKITSLTLTKASGTDRNFDILTSDTPFDSATTASLKGQATAAKKLVTTEGVTWTFETNHKYFAIVICDKFAAYLSSIEIEYYVCPHVNTTAIGTAKDATCTEDGITAGKKCLDCDEIIEAQETIKATGHNFVDGECTGCGEKQCNEHAWVDDEVTIEPTCTTTGIQAQHCQNCNEPGEKVLEVIPHTEVTDEAKEPTCTETGLTEGSHCSVCEMVIVEQTVVEKVAHDYVDGVCLVCGDIFVDGAKLADFEFGADGEGKTEGSQPIDVGVIETNGGYELDFTTATMVYDNSWDALGNAVLKFGTASKVGVIEFTVPSNVKTVVMYVAGRQTANAEITVNGTTYSITTHSNDGEYTKIVVDTTENKTVNFTTTSKGYRAMVNSIEFWGKEIGKVAGNTVTLGDTIGVNFYMTLTEETLADSTAYVEFTLPNEKVEKVAIAEGKPNGVYYQFACNIAVKEIVDDIKAKIVTVDGSSKEYTYSVKAYAEYIIEHSASYTENDIALAKSLLNYGAYAQKMFDYKTEILANSTLEEADTSLADVTIAESYIKNYTANVEGVTYKGTSTIWQSDMAIRHYFDITGENVTFKLYTADGTFIKDLEIFDGGANVKYVAIDGIVAKDMATTYKLVISNGSEEQTINYSVYSYFYDILGGTYSDDEKNAMKAAYLYSQATITYLAEK